LDVYRCGLMMEMLRYNLAGLAACLLNRLQWILNITAWSIAGLQRSDHNTDAAASFP